MSKLVVGNVQMISATGFERDSGRVVPGFLYGFSLLDQLGVLGTLGFTNEQDAERARAAVAEATTGGGWTPAR